MRTYIYDGDIDTEGFERFRDYVLECAETTFPVTKVKISSHGGLAMLQNDFIELINNFGIEVEAGDSLESAAFEIFYKVKTKKILSEYFDVAMTHLPSRFANIYEISTKATAGNLVKASSSKRIRSVLSEAKDYLDRPQLIKFKKGDEVYISREQMQKIIDKQNKLNGHN